MKGTAGGRLTVEAVLQKLQEQAGRLEPTVDRPLFGSPGMEVTGIVTTFLASQDVLGQAAALGANLVISHEGLFYSHQEPQGWLAEDPVCLTKRQWIEQSGMAVFRFHDHVHRYRPDFITEGLVRALGWDSYVEEHLPAACIVSMPAKSLRTLAEEVKSKLGIPYVRTVGGSGTHCSRIGLLVGYRGGGATSIPLMESHKLDLLIAGEGPEWETPEYIRDAVHQGRGKALMILGHAASEEPGMRYLAEQLSGEFPGVPVHFIAEKPLFQIL
ncbi:Nif3-like dinuclear metal center hexameric protein [Paenibacillus sp. P26]|nr:Nif3-like dinuclear metal center hexameric protein [Paenibacillus sp. P26]